ncbi:MAG: NUDIX domain-containing protein [Flavobacteriales bacterium]
MYKVFINDKVFLIGFNLKKSFFDKKFLFSTCYTLQDFQEVLDTNESGQDVIVNFPTLRLMEKVLAKRFRIVEAGGGLVVNKNNEVLFIFRRGKWDLPKGKLEKHEKIKKGAIREVEEECGITNPVIKESLITTMHKFKNKGKECIKKTYWYIMEYDGDEELVPQLDEDITKAKWMGEDKFHKVFKNTFASISDVLNAYMERA